MLNRLNSQTQFSCSSCSNNHVDLSSIKIANSTAHKQKSSNMPPYSNYCFIGFLQSFILNPSYKPFIGFDDLAFGFFDAQFVTRNSGAFTSIMQIYKQAINTFNQKNNKEAKSYRVKEYVGFSKKNLSTSVFIKEIKKLLKQISDYVLLDDPLQNICKLAINDLNDFQKNIKNSQSNILKSKDQKLRKSEDLVVQTRIDHGHKNKVKAPTFRQHIQMALYLKNYSEDQVLMRKIGEVCNIISQNQQQYVFDLSKSSLWTDLIDRNY